MKKRPAKLHYSLTANKKTPRRFRLPLFTQSLRVGTIEPEENDPNQGVGTAFLFSSHTRAGKKKHYIVGIHLHSGFVVSPP